MATYSITNAVAGVAVGRKPQVVSVDLDCSSTTLTTADSIEVLEIPANTLVINAGIQVTLGSDGAADLSLGDDDTANQFVDAADGQNSGVTSVGTTAKLYTAADTLDLTSATATFNGKVRVFATIVELPDEADQTPA